MRFRPVALSSLVLAIVFAAACGDDAIDPPGALTVTCALEADAPVVGQNAVIITVSLGEVPVLDATISVDAQMPTHGHGSTETPVVEQLGDGRYRAFPVTFQMPGRWEVTVEARSGEDTGSDVLELDVPAS